jgi:hypothetical protein
MEVRPLVRRLFYSYSLFLVVVLLAHWHYGILLPIAVVPVRPTAEFADPGTVQALRFLWPNLFLAFVFAFETLDRGDYHPVDWLRVSADGPRVQPSLVMLAVASVVVWPIVLPYTQPAQQRRSAVDEAIARGDYDRVVARLRQWPREAFPPHWIPGPPAVWPDTLQRHLPKLAHLADADLPDWAAERYRERLDHVLTCYNFQLYLADEATARSLATMPAVRRWVERQDSAHKRPDDNASYLRSLEAESLRDKSP